MVNINTQYPIASSRLHVCLACKITVRMQLPNKERSADGGGEYSTLFVECQQNQRVVIVLLD